MMQVVEQTHEERVKMYMRCKKKELAEMLANCNEVMGRWTLQPPRRMQVDAMPLDDWRSGHIYQSNS